MLNLTLPSFQKLCVRLKKENCKLKFENQRLLNQNSILFDENILQKTGLIYNQTSNSNNTDGPQLTPIQLAKINDIPKTKAGDIKFVNYMLLAVFGSDELSQNSGKIERGSA